MKNKFLSMIAAACVAAVAFTANAADVGPLFTDEAAGWDANLMVRIDHTDLTETTTNTAQSITNLVPIAAGSSLQLVAMVLEQDFDTGNTNYTGSTLLEVGDGSDADFFLTSTELASDGTEVDLKLGRLAGGSVALSFQTASVTNWTSVTNVYTVVTNGTATFTASSLGAAAYTSANDVKFKFTPNAEESLSALTSGAVRIYFRRLPANP